MKALHTSVIKAAGLIAALPRALAGGLIAVLLLLTFGSGAAAAPIDQPDDSASLAGNNDLQGILRIMEDKDGSLTPEQAAAPAMDALYEPYSSSGFAGTLSKSVYWVKLDLYNDAARTRDFMLELSKPQLGKVTLYQFNDERKLSSETVTGRRLPFYDRSYIHRNFIFHLSFAPMSGEKLYFKIETDTFLQLPMKLWDTQSFLEKEQHQDLLFGVYYGIMLVMALYNIFLFISIRERTYLYYVLFILSFAVMQAVWDGFAYQFLWPDFPGWEVRANPMFITLTGLFALLFSLNFLSVPKYSPRMARIMQFFTVVLILALPAILLLSPAAGTRLAVCLSSVSILFCLGAILAVRFRIRSVFFYIFAWIVLFAGALLNILAAYKLIPLNFWSLYSIRFGSAAETVLLSLALADRFNGIRHEKTLEEKQGALLKQLHETTKRLTSTHDLDELLQFTMTSLSKITACEHGFILLEKEGGYELTAQTGAGPWYGLNAAEPESEAFLRRLIVEKQLILLSGHEDLSLPDPLARTFLGIPILYHDRMIGAVVLYSYFARRITGNERSILRDFAGQVGISMENVRLFSEINRLASIDGLTGVYNRSHFLKLARRHLAQCRNTGVPLSLIMVDIDHFKSINDRYGHLMGDKVIQETVKRLAELAQPRGIIGRYGGEEFVLVLPGVTAPQAIRLAEIMRKSIAASPVSMQGQSISYTISLGLSSLGPDTHEITSLVDQADRALYLAKESGRNSVKTL
ncbi:hypothetical protein PSTEL_01725 [Paenibacillus stellifer]|uniref:GGDEF domain-containing protein n=2 Tax=Paenibacillus stellifer TaxID=169760 RepID=A0A089N038_9BACL|nr:hypothetical protein PSTEL_01725 [Paenibacillus stellifer]